jgi:hypothetical protein
MGLFKKAIRTVWNVESHYNLIFTTLTSSFLTLKSEGLIDEKLEVEFFDLLIYFWEYLYERGDTTNSEYLSFYLTASIKPKENYLNIYLFTDEEKPLYELIVFDLINEFRKYGSVDLRRQPDDFGINIPNDTIKIIESRGYECALGSPNFAMSYAVATTYVYILNKSDSDSRVDRIGKRVLASEVLPIFLTFWLFRNNASK